jgi:hypothetical protein
MTEGSNLLTVETSEEPRSQNKYYNSDRRGRLNCLLSVCSYSPQTEDSFGLFGNVIVEDNSLSVVGKRRNGKGEEEEE